MHYASLPVGAAIILFAGRNHWFFYDEWSFVQRGDDLFSGHNGHWSTVSITVWNGVQAVFGLSSYFPFLLVAVLSHLVLVHLLWRLLRMTGASVWISTSVALLGLLLGAGAENLLWAFQFGFIGAMCFGMGALLLTVARARPVPAGVGVAALLLAGTATSGTAIPFYVAVAAAGTIMRGWRWTFVTLIGPSVLYGAWYVFLAGANPIARYQVDDPVTALFAAPAYMGEMLVGSWTAVTPFPGAGILVCAAAAVLLVRGAAHLGTRRGDTTLVIATIAAAVVFGLLSGYSRWDGGIEGATSSRYVYFIFFMTAPVIGVAITRLTRDARASQLAAIACIMMLTVFNIGLLFDRARMETARETLAHETLSAAVALHEHHPEAVNAEQEADRRYTPLSLVEVEALRDTAGLTLIPYSDLALANAAVNVGIQFDPTTEGTTRCTNIEKGAEVELIEGLSLLAGRAATLTIYARVGEVSGNSRDVTLAPGAYRLRAVPEARFFVSEGAEDLTMCGLGR